MAEMTREEKIAAAQAKWMSSLSREEKVALAQAKWEQENAAQEPTTSENIETAIRSGLSSATLGASEPVISGLSSLVGKAIEPEKPLSQLYSEDVSRREALQQKASTADIAASLTGALSPVGPAATAFKGIKGAVEGAKVLKEIPVIAKILGAGAAAGGSEAIEQAAKSIGGFKSDGDALEAAKTGAELEAGLSALGAAGRGAGKALGWAGKKLLSGIGRVPESSIDMYLANRDAIQGAKSIEEIKSIVDETVGGLKKDIENATLSHEQAKDALKNVVADIKESSKIKISDAQLKLRDAEKELSDAFNREKNILRETKAPIHLVSEVTDSTNEVKKKLIQASNDASELLNQSKEKIAIKPILDKIDSEIGGIKISGVEFGPEDKKAIAALQSIKDDFKKLPAEMPLSQTKTLLKKLDRIIDYDVEIGAFDSPASLALKNIRGDLRKKLGELVPAYDQAMKETVVPLAELRSKAAALFPNRDAIASKLLRIDSPVMQETRDVLQKLGETTQKDFSGVIGEFGKARGLLKSPLAMEQLKSALPESKALGMAEQKLASVMSPQAMAQLEAQKGLPLVQSRFAEAQMALEKAKQEFEPFKIFSELTSEQKIKAVMRGNIAVRNRMAQLAKVADQDLEGMINAAKAKSDFYKEISQGSTSTNLWSILGYAAVGGALGDPQTGLMTGALGAVLGTLQNKYGTRGVKRILDGVLTIKGMPTIKKIEALDLPENFKTELKDSLIRAVSGLKSEKPISLDDDLKPQVKQEIQDSEMSPSEKAMAITQLNKSGQVSGLNKLMLGNEMYAQKELKPSFGKEKNKAIILKNASDFVESRKPESF